MSSDDIGTGKDLAVYRLEKAEQCLSDAETLFNKGSYEGAVNRSYYCIYHSIRSILALDEVEFKRHSGNNLIFVRIILKQAYLINLYQL